MPAAEPAAAPVAVAAAENVPDEEEEAAPEPKQEEKKAIKVVKADKKAVPEKKSAKAPAKKNVAKATPKKTGKKALAKKKADSAALAKQKELLKQAMAGLDKSKNAGKGAGTVKGQGRNPAKTSTAASPSAAYGIGDNSLFDSATEGVDPAFWGYCEELVNRLQLMLRLPEYGEVKVLVTIDSNGVVRKVQIKESKSALNRSYIEKNMADVAFPCFGSNFPGEKDHTFFLALTSKA